MDNITQVLLNKDSSGNRWNTRNIKKMPCCLIITAVVLLSVLSAGCNNGNNKIYTVGLINIFPEFDHTLVGFKEGMTQLGYIEGENIRYIYNGPTRDMDKLSEAAQALMEAKVDLILSLTTPATLAVKQVTAHSEVPVVFSVVTDPVGAKIVDSLKHTGCHITGITFGIQEARRLNWLVQIAPSIKQIYVPFNPMDKSPVLALRMVRKAAAELGVSLILREVGNLEALNDAIINIPEQADAVFFLPGSLLSTRFAEFVKAANDRNLPTSAASIDALKDYPILTSFGFEQYPNSKKVARMVDQIFKGAEPGDLPVEIAEFHLGINLKVAEIIGLTVPENILRQADLIVR